MPVRAQILLSLLFLSLLGPLMAQPPADSSLVLHLPFGAGARDESLWRHRVVEHQASYGADRNGRRNGAFYANGADAYLEIPPAPELNLTGCLTLSLWAKVEESWPANAELTLLWRGADIAHPAFRLAISGLGFIGLGYSFIHVPSPERWDHYAACRDTINKALRLYLNGQLKATLPLAPQHMAGIGLPLIIGGLVGPDKVEMWQGWIDDVRVYNRVLSPPEMAALTEGYTFPSEASVYTKIDRLNPGRYLLAPVVSPETLSLAQGRLLVVYDKEPVWKKGWFMGMVAAAAAAFSLLGAWFFFRQRQLEQTLGFEKIRMLEAERFRIAREMHEDIGTGLSALHLLTDVALHKNLEPGLAAEIEHIANAGLKVSARIREIVWAIDMRHDSLEHLIIYFQQYATDFFHHAGVEVNLTLPPPRLPAKQLPGNTRRMIFLAYKEALHNILKHAQATRVYIEFALAHQHLDIRIHDNGHGFDPAAAGDAGNGLINMRKRMEDIGGEFRIESGETGTRVAFRVVV